jgi:hypothetical protein
MNADVTQMNTDTLIFNRMWDKSTHPVNHQSFQLIGFLIYGLTKQVPWAG